MVLISPCVSSIRSVGIAQFPPIERVRRKGEGSDLGQGGGVKQRPWLK